MTELRRLQQDSDDLNMTIAYLEHSILPANTHIVKYTHVLCATQITGVSILEDGILYHLYTPRNKKINTVKPVIKQLAVPISMRKQVLLQAFHDDLGHWRLDKCYSTIRQFYYWL